MFLINMLNHMNDDVEVCESSKSDAHVEDT